MYHFINLPTLNFQVQLENFLIHFGKVCFCFGISDRLAGSFRSFRQKAEREGTGSGRSVPGTGSGGILGFGNQ